MLACLCLKFDLGHIDRTRNYKLCSTTGTAGPKYFPVIWLQPGRGHFRTSTSLRCTKRGHKSQGYSVDTEKKGIQCPCCYDWIVPDRDKKKRLFKYLFFQNRPKGRGRFRTSTSLRCTKRGHKSLNLPLFLLNYFDLQYSSF